MAFWHTLKLITVIDRTSELRIWCLATAIHDIDMCVTFSSKSCLLCWLDSRHAFLDKILVGQGDLQNCGQPLKARSTTCARV
ncbi:unnamed protein product [Sphenostylis stenocarpa]|uniref:Uncharacterized protein n=1 Tax=Sphenostylis stenocarpa TaxID=92480 RepID=A0AA87BC89_9FABA|nr:unnamed protein product [Sphenostylis stenocarpa]